MDMETSRMRTHKSDCDCPYCVPRKGDWMQTYRGDDFWPLDPLVDDIYVVDMAHSLAHQCRFFGHTETFYSVAEHSVRASYIVQPTAGLIAMVIFARRESGVTGALTDEEKIEGERIIRRATLLHDGAETYIGDAIRPLKRHLGPVYLGAEQDLERLVADRFDVPAFLFTHEVIKRADLVMLMTERRDLLKPPRKKWMRDWGPAQASGRCEPHPEPIARPCWTPEEGKRRFLERFVELGGRQDALEEGAASCA